MGLHHGEQILEKKRVMNIADIQGEDIWPGKKKINDILLSNQWETNGVRPYTESLIFLEQMQTIFHTSLQQFQW